MTPALPNLLAAAALLITDAVEERLERAVGRSRSAAAALVMLGREPLSIDDLRAALGVTHSGTVRLVDRLEDDGLVHRSRSGRVVTVNLSKRGRHACERVEHARLDAAADLLAPLTASQQAQLEALLRRILASRTEDLSDLHRICRLCSFDACERPAQTCPVADAARAAS